MPERDEGRRRALRGWLTALVVAASAARADAVPATGVFAHPEAPPALVRLIGPSAAKLNQAAALSGRFEQRKVLAELPKPLVSDGDFLVARGLGVEWHTTQPFDAAVVLTPQALLQRGADGSTQTIPADQQPGLRAVGQVFDALFTLDLAKLDETFALYGEARPGGGWELGLVPRDEAFASHIARIDITGHAHPMHMVLYEPGGDRTEIDFSAVDTHKALSEAQRQRFQP